jgi:hypothetical protein
MEEIYLFLDRGCLSCIQIRFDLNMVQYLGWEKKIKVVEVIGETAYLNGKDCGKVPVSKTPALYFTAIEEIVYGYSEIMERIKNGIICIKNNS